MYNLWIFHENQRTNSTAYFSWNYHKFPDMPNVLDSAGWRHVLFHEFITKFPNTPNVLLAGDMCCFVKIWQISRHALCFRLCWLATCAVSSLAELWTAGAAHKVKRHKLLLFCMILYWNYYQLFSLQN